MLFCAGAWSALYNTQQQWIYADLQTTHRIESVTTQGRPWIHVSQWVESYQVTYSQDGRKWTNLPDVYVGNLNRDDKKTNTLPDNFETRYIGLRPVTWHDHISLRWDVTGCVAHGKIPLYTLITLLTATGRKISAPKNSESQIGVYIFF